MTYRIRGHREAGYGLPAIEWPLLAAAGQPAEFHTREEAERLVSMCNAALAHSPARITYAVEEAPEIRRVPIITDQRAERLTIVQPDAIAADGSLIDFKLSINPALFNTSASWPEEWPAAEGLPANKMADRDKQDWLNSRAEEWPADDTGAPLTT